MSFGHFTLDLSPVFWAIVSHTANAATKPRSGLFLAGILGLKIIDNHIPPPGEIHLLFILPLPLSCFSANITVPFNASGLFSAREISSSFLVFLLYSARL